MTDKLKNMSKQNLKQKLKVVMNKVKTDGWGNLFTGVGAQNIDKKTGGFFAKNTRLQRDELTALYTNDGMSKRVIDVKIEDMLREKYRIPNDTEDLIIQASKELQFFKNLNEALTWQDVYGGSLMLMGIDDGRENFEEELNEQNIKKIEFLKVYDRHQINVDPTRLYDDPKEAKYGEPQWYNISPDGGGTPFDIHESRVLRFDGVLLPDIEKIGNDYWNDSVYQAYYERLKGLGNTYGNIETIIEEFIIGVMKLDNLEQLLQGPAGEDVLNRLHYIDMAKHIINTILLDKEEEFERVSAAVSGLEELVTKLESGLSAITGIPVTRLFGQSPKGLNASGQETMQMKQYYDMIASRQERKMFDQITHFNELLMLSKEGPTKGQFHDDWVIEFNPLWIPTDEEISKTRKTNAESDKIYWEMGLPESVILSSRFGGTSYGMDIVLPDTFRSFLESQEKQFSEAAKNGVFSIQGNNPKDKEEVDNPKNKDKE